MILTNLFKHCIITILFLLFPSFIIAQELNNESKTLKNEIMDMPSFTIYGDNYLITGTTLGETPDANNSDAKLKIGFKQRLTNKRLPFNTYLFFTYQQIAFWDVFKKSFPFREINYNPSLALVKAHYKNGEYNGFIQFQFEHESNGLDGDSSRSWNRFSLIYERFLSQRLTGIAKVWVPIGNMDGNPDITDFRGYQELSLSYKMNQHFIFETQMRKAFSLDLKGSILIGANYRISERSDQFIYLQYFLGYSENLIDYNQSTQRLRIGIVFKDLFLRFRK